MNHVRDLLRRDDAAPGSRSGPADVDIEAGAHAAAAAPPPAVPPTKSPPPTSSAGTPPLDAQAQLQAFRQLVGITPAPGLDAPAAGSAKSAKPTRAAPNVGIYAKVVSNEKWAHRSYTAYAWVINIGLFLQVLVAAALTAMGAAGINHAVITAFGAVNTAIAGFHTYLQGYGLPGRLRYYETAWAKVREAIEQRERDFAGAAAFGQPVLDGSSLAQAVADIEKLYSDTLTEVENTTPTGFRTTTSKSGGAQQPASTAAAPPGINPPVQVANPSEKLLGSSIEPSINTHSLPSQAVDVQPSPHIADAATERVANESHH